MDIKVHPLQEKSVDLLKALYFDKNLGVTKAMHMVIDGYYPSIENVLGTLEYYKNEIIVSDFSNQNSNLIEQAKAELVKRKSEFRGNASGSDFIDDIFSGPDPVNAYSTIKEHSIHDIEHAMSVALSSICNEELLLNIHSVVESGGLFNSDVEMRVTITPKNTFR